MFGEEEGGGEGFIDIFAVVLWWVFIKLLSMLKGKELQFFFSRIRVLSGKY